MPDNLRIAAGLGDMVRLRQFFDDWRQSTPEAAADRKSWPQSYELSNRPTPQDEAGILAEGLLYAASTVSRLIP